MAWEAIFGAANMLAIGAWVLLIFVPRWPLLMALLLYLGVGLLCLVYAASLIGILSGVIPNETGGEFNFSSIEGVRAIFASDAGVTIGWVHYLAFDLFVGIWIAKDGDGKGINRIIQAPVLLATFLAGPIGLFLWLILREPAARRQNKRI